MKSDNFWKLLICFAVCLQHLPKYLCQLCPRSPFLELLPAPRNHALPWRQHRWGCILEDILENKTGEARQNSKQQHKKQHPVYLKCWKKQCLVTTLLRECCVCSHSCLIIKSCCVKIPDAVAYTDAGLSSALLRSTLLQRVRLLVRLEVFWPCGSKPLVSSAVLYLGYLWLTYNYILQLGFLHLGCCTWTSMRSLLFWEPASLQHA